MLHCDTVHGGGACSTLCWISVTPSTTHNQLGPLWCWFPSGWACAHSRPLWVSPVNSPVRLGVSPAASTTPTGVFTQRFEALFRPAGTLGYAVCFDPCHLSGLSVCKCRVARSGGGHTACPVHPTLSQSRSRQGHVSPLHPGAGSCPSYWSG